MLAGSRPAKQTGCYNSSYVNSWYFTQLVFNSIYSSSSSKMRLAWWHHYDVNRGYLIRRDKLLERKFTSECLHLMVGRQSAYIYKLHKITKLVSCSETICGSWWGEKGNDRVVHVDIRTRSQFTSSRLQWTSSCSYFRLSKFTVWNVLFGFSLEPPPPPPTRPSIQPPPVPLPTLNQWL